MARAARAPQSKKPAGSAGNASRSTTALAKTPAKRAKAPAAKSTPTTTSLAALKLSKDELRARVETLERANAALRAKGRDANRAAKTADARIAELEDQVARLEKRLASAQPKPKPSAPSRRQQRSREIDPGDAVPEGVAVQDPAPLDEEAEAALENLEEHLGANPPE